jgi:acyl-CoA synthetase (AMP-forming)/AMP-acid ligase II
MGHIDNRNQGSVEMTMQQTPLLMTRLLKRGAQLFPDEEIVTLTAAGRQRQSYRETWARAGQLANALSAHGIGAADRVASFMWNNARHLELYQGVPCMGAVLHTLNIRLGPQDLDYIINHAADRVIFVDQDLLPVLERLAGRMSSVELFVICREAGAEPVQTSLAPVIDYEDFIARQAPEYAWPERDENAPLGLCYTSGTTGEPKGVMYTHRSTYLHTLSSAMTDVIRLSTTDSLCGIVPMFHAMGWGLPFTATMLGAKQVMPHRYMAPDKLVELFEAEAVTVSAGVPTIWQGVKAAIEANPGKYDLSRLDRAICGGAAPPPSLIRWYWEALGVEMIQGWGMTETNPIGTIARRVNKRSELALDEDAQFDNMAKAGLPLAGLDIDIVDEQFNPLPHDGQAIGELLIRGPWICSAYFQNPQPDKFHDDWLVTGDVAAIDAAGYVMIRDRSKDLIKSGGEWISSVDLENDLVAMPGVRLAAVVAQPHPRWDERPVALLVLEAGAAAPDLEAVRQHCSKRFARWQLPDDVLIVPELPLTSTGKIDKKTIRKQLSDDGYRLPELMA